MAPAFALALLLILGRLDRHNAQMDVETATFERQFAHEEASFDRDFARDDASLERDFAVFDQQFAHDQAGSATKNDDQEFWLQQQKSAEKRLKIAEKNLVSKNDGQEFWLEQKKNAEKQLKIAEEKKAKADGKVSQQVDILEKTLKEMDEKENQK